MINRNQFQKIGEGKTLRLLNQKIKCFERREFSNNVKMEYMMYLLLKNFFNINFLLIPHFNLPSSTIIQLIVIKKLWCYLVCLVFGFF